MNGAQLELARANSSDVTVLEGTYDISPQGDRIVAMGRGPGAPENHRGVHVFSYEDGVIEHIAEVRVRDGLPPFDPGVWMLRFSPDGGRVLIPNGPGYGTKGTFDAKREVLATAAQPRRHESPTGRLKPRRRHAHALEGVFGTPRRTLSAPVIALHNNWRLSPTCPAPAPIMRLNCNRSATTYGPQRRLPTRPLRRDRPHRRGGHG